MNEFGQRSVVSLLRTCSSTRPGAQVSLAEFLDRKCAGGSSKRSLHEDEKAEPDAATSSQRVCDDLATYRLSKRRQPHHKGRANTERRRPTECSKKPQMLVVGDMPAKRPKSCGRQISQNHAYNHYIDGNGWWGEESVGMEEAGAACEWEGLGSMSLGISATGSP